jgi:hypothetical protein
MPEAASNLVGIARARAAAAALGITSIAVVRSRVVVQPIALDKEQSGKLAARGAVYLERDRKLQVPLAYGESVVSGVLGTLDAILSIASPNPV